jgi:hypothetical protein
MSRRRASPEQGIQRALFQHLRVRGVPGLFAFHPPNGGYRRPIEAKIFQGLGVVSGAPDVFIIHHGQVYALELKSEDGRLTASQVLVQNALREAGAQVATTYGLDAALEQLERWNLLRGRAAA